MTKKYDFRMAARHLQTSATIKDTITKANLPLLGPEAMEDLEKEASIQRKASFEDEADISYVYMDMDQYDGDRERILNNRMQTILEGQELSPKVHETSLNAGLPLEDIDKLAVSNSSVSMTT